MKKKSNAYYRYCAEQGSGKASYYEADEIEDIANDLLDEGLIDDALVATRMGLNLHPNDENLEKLEIWIMSHAQQIEEAERKFTKYANDDDIFTYRMKFCFEVRHGHIEHAFQQFLPLLKEGKVPAIDWVQAVDEMFDAIPKETLAPYLLLCMDFFPLDNAEAIARLGAMLMDVEQFKQAAILFEKSLDLNAYDIYTWQDLSRCYLFLQETDKCLEACEYGLAVDPENPLFNFQKGYIKFERKEFDEAIACLEIARKYAEGKLKKDDFQMDEREIADNIAICYNTLACCYMATHQVEKSEECIDILMERKQIKPEMVMHLSSYYMIEAQYAKAIKLVERAEKALPRSSEIVTLHISLLTSFHRFDEALDMTAELCRMKPRSKSALLARAELALNIGRMEVADNAFRKLLTMLPKNKMHLQLISDYFVSIGDKDAIKTISNAVKKKKN